MTHRIVALLGIAAVLAIGIHACAAEATPVPPRGEGEPQAELVLRYCRTAAPGECQEQHPLLGPVPQSVCLKVLQFIASSWLA
jgi:hypothetical protein